MNSATLVQVAMTLLNQIAVPGTVSAIIAIFAVRRAYYGPIFMKSVEIKNDFDKRYDELYDARLAFEAVPDRTPEAIEVKSYFIRYWSLQSSQFEFFLIGVLDPYIYSGWVLRKLRLFREPYIIPGWSATDGWQRFGRPTQEQNSLFIAFVEKIKSYSLQRFVSYDVDEAFSRDLISEIYNLPSARKFRRSASTRGGRWKTTELMELHAAMRHDANQIGYTQFTNPALFRDVVVHEKEHIVGPAILAVLQSDQDRPTERVLDYGCGTFQLGVLLLRAGMVADGYDPDTKMIVDAQEAYGAEVIGRLFSSLSAVVDGYYDAVVLAFVHQLAASRENLKRMLRDAASKLKSGGKMIVIGNHPDFLGTTFSATRFTEPVERVDGMKYTGTLSDGEKEYPLAEEHFYALPTVQQLIGEVGLRVESLAGLEDVASATREAGEGFPYFRIVAIKT